MNPPDKEGESTCSLFARMHVLFQWSEGFCPLTRIAVTPPRRRPSDAGAAGLPRQTGHSSGANIPFWRGCRSSAAGEGSVGSERAKVARARTQVWAELNRFGRPHATEEP